MNTGYKRFIEEGATLAVRIKDTYKPLIVEKSVQAYDSCGKLNEKVEPQRFISYRV